MTVAIVYGHFNGEDSIARIGGWGDASDPPLHRSGIILCLNRQFLSQTYSTENIVRGTKGYLYATDISDRKSIRGRRHKGPQIYISAQNVAGERSRQVGVSQEQLGLKQRRLRIVHRSLRCIESFLRLVEVWLSEAFRRIEGLRSLKILIGSGVLR